MSWRIEPSPPQVVALCFEGPTTAEDLRSSTTHTIALGKERGVRNYLVDAREIELQATVFDLYDLPTRQYNEEHLDRRSRVAVVLPRRPHEIAQAKFYETACVNRGWLVHLFPTPDDALRWLASARGNATAV